MEDLDSFIKLARESYSAFLSRGELKCTKESSGMVGVSPETVKARPPVKRRSAKRLEFGMNKQHLNPRHLLVYSGSFNVFINTLILINEVGE